MLRHSPGATRKRIGSSGTITWKKTNSPAAGRRNIMATNASSATILATRTTCHTRSGTLLVISCVGRERLSLTACVDAEDALGQCDERRAGGPSRWRRRRWGSDDQVSEPRRIMLQLEHARIDRRGVQHDDLGTPEPHHVTGHERHPPGEREAVHRGSVAAPEIDHGQRGRARHQPEVLSRHSFVGQVCTGAVPADDDRSAQHQAPGGATPLPDLDQRRAGHLRSPRAANCISGWPPIVDYRLGKGIVGEMP